MECEHVRRYFNVHKEKQLACARLASCIETFPPSQMWKHVGFQEFTLNEFHRLFKIFGASVNTKSDVYTNSNLIDTQKITIPCLIILSFKNDSLH